MSRMLKRIAVADPVLASYQMSWLHQEPLELCFKSRRLWTMSARKPFAWLAGHDPETCGAFSRIAEARTREQRKEGLREAVERCLGAGR